MPLPPAPPSSRSFGGASLELSRGDLTRQEVDAIVNAANPSLLGGGGVDGAIHRVAGPALLEACRALVASRGRLAPGDAVLTPGFRAPARFVIHTVGPVWGGGSRGEPATLAHCYQSVLALARQEGLASIALPSISTGAYGCPIEEAAPVALRTVRDEVLKGGSVRLVRFVLWSEGDYDCYVRALGALASPPEAG